MSLKKTRISWDYQETLYFLQLMREHQISKSSDGKRLAVDEIFQHLPGRMANQGWFKNAKEMQSRFKTLRYVFNLHKRGLTMSGESNTKRRFPFFQEMSLILDSAAPDSSQLQEETTSGHQVQQQRKTNKTLSASQSNAKSASVFSAIGTIHVDSTLEVPSSNFTLEPVDYSGIPGNKDAPSTSSLLMMMRDEPELIELTSNKVRDDDTQSQKRKKIRGDSEEGTVTLCAALMNRHDSSKPSVDEDEDALFGKMVAQYLKKITNTREKLEAKRKILAGISECTT